MRPEERPLLVERIQQIRTAIRTHRDQVGDDRCWLDDHHVWRLLSDSKNDLTVLPDFETAMRSCVAFYEYRRATRTDPTPADALQNPAVWDQDLDSFSMIELRFCLTDLELKIRSHRDIRGRPRTLEDDRALYAALPEKIPADFRLPKRDIFLGEAVPHAGCPAFWKSHAGCPTHTHNLHAWGPCRPTEAEQT